MELKHVLKLQMILKPTNGNPIDVFKIGKIYCAYLFIKDKVPYAASNNEEASQSVGLIKITGYEKLLEQRKDMTNGPLLPDDHIKITALNFNSAVGEII